MRVGIGYDAHPFEAGRPLVLGGITIPHHLGLSGHSDADVLTHAVIEAVLGAAAAGDIGEHFSDNDPEWRDASSIGLLKKVMAVLGKMGYQVGNVDVTILLEEPKLSPFKEAMRRRLAEVLGANVNTVSLKPKTTNGLGFIGRQEGIAAYAVALIKETG